MFFKSPEIGPSNTKVTISIPIQVTQELDSVILVNPFQLRTFCDSVNSKLTELHSMASSNSQHKRKQNTDQEPSRGLVSLPGNSGHLMCSTCLVLLQCPMSRIPLCPMRQNKSCSLLCLGVTPDYVHRSP